MPLPRRVGNVLWSCLVSLIGNQRVADPASGMRVPRRSALNQFPPLHDGLYFKPAMGTRWVYEGLRVVDVPITCREPVGRSRLSVVRDGTRFLASGADRAEQSARPCGSGWRPDPPYRAGPGPRDRGGEEILSRTLPAVVGRKGAY